MTRRHSLIRVHISAKCGVTLPWPCPLLPPVDILGLAAAKQHRLNYEPHIYHTSTGTDKAACNMHCLTADITIKGHV